MHASFERYAAIDLRSLIWTVIEKCHFTTSQGVYPPIQNFFDGKGNGKGKGNKKSHFAVQLHKRSAFGWTIQQIDKR